MKMTSAIFILALYYLSMEFLIGRTLSNAMLSLGIYEDVQGALEAMGLNLEELIEEICAVL